MDTNSIRDRVRIINSKYGEVFMNTEVMTVSLRTYVKAYLDLCKLRVVSLIVITALVGMCLAAPHGITWHVFILGNLGIMLAACAAAAINHVVDQRIDEKMHRTRSRPLVKGVLTPAQACVFAIILGIIAMFILVYFVNVLTATLTFITLIGYAVIYTMFLKHATPQNIVIGGLAGAAPPLLGWTAVTGQIDANALLLVLIVFLWTPPHFWALAIHRIEDYGKAKVPMLPNTHGIAFTKLNILVYTVLLVLATFMPYFTGMLHIYYLIGTTVLNIMFIYYVWLMQRDTKHSFKLFKFSIVYLFALFIVMLLDHYLF